jgi:outer membrane receptor protein involved in Fe transport
MAPGEMSLLVRPYFIRIALALQGIVSLCLVSPVVLAAVRDQMTPALESCADLVAPTGVDYSDNDLVFAPENAFTVSADYHLDMDSWGALDFNANYSWKDDYYTAPSNAEKTLQEDIGMIGASAKWTSVDQSWEVTLWGKNLDDEQQIANRIVDPTQITSEMYMAPRTYGATVTKTF